MRDAGRWWERITHMVWLEPHEVHGREDERYALHLPYRALWEVYQSVQDVKCTGCGVIRDIQSEMVPEPSITTGP